MAVAKIKPRTVNPLRMGLLGGLSDWAKMMEKYNLIHEQGLERQKAYQYKYDSLAKMSAARAESNRMAKLAELEAHQKPQISYRKLPDGSYNKISQTYTLDPNDPTKKIPHTEEHPVAAEKVPAAVKAQWGKQGVAGNKEQSGYFDPVTKQFVPSGAPVDKFSPRTTGATGVGPNTIYNRDSIAYNSAVKENESNKKLLSAKMAEAKKMYEDQNLRPLVFENAGMPRDTPNTPENRAKALKAIEEDLKKDYGPKDLPAKPDAAAISATAAAARTAAGAPAAAGAPPDANGGLPQVVPDKDGNPRPVKYITKKDGTVVTLTKNADGAGVPVIVKDGVIINAPPMALDQKPEQAAPAPGGSPSAMVAPEEPDDETEQAADDDSDIDPEEEASVAPQEGLTGYA